MFEKYSPNRVSAELRHIASIIESSEKPSLELVTKDIASIVDKLQGSDKIKIASRKMAKYMLTVAEEIEEIDISEWETEQGQHVEENYEQAQKFEEGDKLETAVKMLKRSIDKFLGQLMEPESSSPVPDNSEIFTSVR